MSTSSLSHNHKSYLTFISIEQILLLCIIIAELMRFIMPFFYNPVDHLWSDPGRWWKYASLGIETPPLALIDAPMFQAWISFIAKLTLDIPELTALYAGLLSATMPWFWYRLLRELMDSKKLALLGWLIIACLPSWTGIYSYFMSETLLLPLLGLSLWLSVRSLQKKDCGSFILATFFWLLCSLTRGLTAPIMLLVLFIIWLQQHHKWKTALLSVLLCSLAIGSLSYRSYVRSGLIAPLGQPMLNSVYALSGKREIVINYVDSNYSFIYGFSSPSINSQPFYPFYQWTSMRQGVIQIDIELDDQFSSWKRAKQQAKASNTLSGFQLIKENFIFLFFGSSWPDNNPQHFIEQIAVWMRFIWLPLSLLAVILLLQNLSRGVCYRSLLLLSVWICWFVFQGLALVSFNEGRYRKPIEGVVVVMLLFAFDQRKTRK